MFVLQPRIDYTFSHYPKNAVNFMIRHFEKYAYKSQRKIRKLNADIGFYEKIAFYR